MKSTLTQKLSQLYPAISKWTSSWGWIEIGEDGQTGNSVRALDEGGLIKEIPVNGDVDKAIDEMELALSEFIKANS